MFELLIQKPDDFSLSYFHQTVRTRSVGECIVRTGQFEATTFLDAKCPIGIGFIFHSLLWYFFNFMQRDCVAE